MNVVFPFENIHTYRVGISGKRMSTKNFLNSFSGNLIDTGVGNNVCLMAYGFKFSDTRDFTVFVFFNQPTSLVIEYK